jgi:hypothetical protein
VVPLHLDVPYRLSCLLGLTNNMEWSAAGADIKVRCTCRRLAAPRYSAGVVKMRRGLTAKYMAQLVSMREIYEAFDTWAAEIDAKSQRVKSGLPRNASFCGPPGQLSPWECCACDGRWPNLCATLTLLALHWS